MAGADHPRLLLPRFLPLPLCSELLFIHRSCAAVGYRPGVLSTTLSHLIATRCPHLILPFLSARHSLRDVVESFFSCEYDLVIEFTGLVGWCRGSSIAWHSDDNRSYLQQRHFTAVCYLTTHGRDFRGGALRFLDGEPSRVLPAAGDAVIYTADDRNVHAVDEVLEGERVTLTLWFSRDSAHDEDAKLIARLDEWSRSARPECLHPLPASSSMYLISGMDIRCARIHVLGYGFCVAGGEDRDPMEEGPVFLCRGEEVFGKEFTNVMHALQVVQFHQWKHAQLRLLGERRGIGAGGLVELGLVRTRSNQELMILCDDHAADMLFGGSGSGDSAVGFNWKEFAVAVEEWEDYVQNLHGVLLASLGSWRDHQAIFNVESAEE